PLGSVHGAMSVGKRRVVSVNQTFMSASNEMPYLMRDGKGVRGASVMGDEECFLRVGADACRETASGRAVDDQTDDVGTLLVAQFPYILEGTKSVDHPVKMIELLAFRFLVVDQLCMHEPQADVAKPTEPESLVCIFDR